MKNLAILHISDLHFSKKNVTPSTIDLKDRTLSNGFISAISNKAEEQFLNDIIGFKPNDGFDFIACTGDLGEYGLKDNIKLGAKYLERLSKALTIAPENVLISPGNHDLKRRRKPENELKEFCEICDDLGFTYSDYDSSTLKFFNNIPVLILNTCLGGTEKAYYEYSEKEWGKIKSLLKKGNKIFKEDLDIPAIGTNQLSNLKSSICDDCQGDFSVILMHHNPLPTNNVELKPYANILDGGPFLSYCIESQKHIIVLHGHTHCDAEMTVSKYNNRGDQQGWVTAIGKKKFYHSASIIDVWLTNDNNFIKAQVQDIEYVSSKYNSSFKSILRSTFIPKPPRWINNMPESGHKLKFQDFANQIGIEANEKLAIQLLQNENRIIDINKNGSINFNDWSVGSLL